ncbi:MAG TPA: hypothetical protein VGQ87_00475, partial [Patescibacteria group bacterium]|nr:hypothetical protein [Patescibacteria group bacterium]
MINFPSTVLAYSAVITSGLPVVGPPKIAGLFFLGSLIGGYVFYKLLDELPKLVTKKLSDKQELIFIKIMIALVSAALLSGAWDVWWHRARGRDSLFEPPHILMYSLATIGVCLGIYVWQHTKLKVW